MGCGAGSDEAVLKPRKPQTTFTGPPLKAKDRNFHQTVDLIEKPGVEIRVVEATALTSPNVPYLGAVAVWPRDLTPAGIGGGPKFPPPGNGHHALDQVIPGTETSFVPAGWDEAAPVSVAFGFRLDGTDDGAVNGMRVVYEVDGKRKAALHRIAIVACPPPKGCPRSGKEPDFSERCFVGTASCLTDVTSAY